MTTEQFISPDVMSPDVISPEDTVLRERALKRLQKKRGLQAHFLVYTLVNSFIVAIWLMTGADGFFWPVEGRRFAVTDENVAAHHAVAADWRHAIPAGERHKTLAHAETLREGRAQARYIIVCGRHSFLVPFVPVDGRCA